MKVGKMRRSKLKVKSGDLVIVIAGSSRGETGRIEEVDPVARKVRVEGVARQVRHVRPSQKNHEGGREAFNRFIHVSNVALFNEKIQRADKVSIKIVSGEKKRCFKKTGDFVDGREDAGSSVTG